MFVVPQKGIVKVISNVGIVGVSPPGTAVPGNATTLLAGAVTELISAANNTQDNWGIEIFISGTGLIATAAEAKMDILIGGATDDLLIGSLICGYAISGNGYRYFFPIHVPGGVRIAAVLTSVRTSITSWVCCWLYSGAAPPFRVGRKVTTYGTAINGARGVAVSVTSSGGAAAATQITASTSADHFAFLPGFQPATDSTIAAGSTNIGIGVGAATEQRIGTWVFGKDANEALTGPHPSLPAFADVPSGTRLTILASNSSVADTAYDGHIYAVS